jgi:large subunit ribosomal protein L25
MPIQLNLQKRVKLGSREARRLRRAGFLPGVIYGGIENEESVKMETHEFMSKIGYAKSLGIVELNLDGTIHKSIIKDVQWDSLSDQPVHTDFQVVSDDQLVTVPVPVHLEGNPKGVLIDGGILDHTMYEVMVTVRAADIPHELIFNVEHLRLNERLHLSEVALPEGLSVDLTTDPVIATVIPPKTLKLTEEEEAEAEGEEGETAGAGGEEAAEEAGE